MDIKNQVFVLKRGRNNRLVGYTDIGKVIIARGNGLRPGFAQVVSFEEKDTCFIAEMENVPYDYYEGMPLDELKQVLDDLGFTLEYTEPIDKENSFLVYANLETGDVITIETWDGDEYNSVNVYIPTGNTLAFEIRDGYGFSHGGFNVCCFNIVFSRSDFPIRNVLGLSSKTKDWNGDHPSMWHYGTKKDNDGNIDFIEAAEKVLKCKDDLNKLFNMRIEEAVQRMKNW